MSLSSESIGLSISPHYNSYECKIVYSILTLLKNVCFIQIASFPPNRYPSYPFPTGMGDFFFIRLVMIQEIFNVTSCVVSLTGF